MAKVGVLRDPETKEQYFPITVADAVIGLTPGGSGTVTQVTAGSGLNTTSGDTTADGGNITANGTLHLTKCNTNVGSFGPSSNASPAAGGTFVVPRITVDKWGRVTALS